jgi:hypothetical protein
MFKFISTCLFSLTYKATFVIITHAQWLSVSNECGERTRSKTYRQTLLGDFERLISKQYQEASNENKCYLEKISMYLHKKSGSWKGIYN